MSSTPDTAATLFSGLFAGKEVLVTGHTGFKGSWLCEWLLLLGARVHGLSLAPETAPSLFEQLGLAARVDHRLGDIRDAGLVRRTIEAVQPDFVFHLAAQPLVRLSYRQPVETYATNVMGTIHVLEALRALQKPCSAVLVTTDKCYENREWLYGYREEDPMGGFDPYSSSKGMAELAIAAYRRSFFAGRAVKIASARAGNVIGGGDWALDRIVPDCIRALQCGAPIGVRNPRATRPWQHVLEPLSGYLWLAARLAGLAACDSPLCSGFNFGPGHDANRTVGELVTEILKHWPGTWEDQSAPNAHHEASLLQLCTDKTSALLGWSATWRFADAIRETVTWYRDTARCAEPSRFQSLTRGQIAAYTAAATGAGSAWTHPSA
ncbi:MAG: CDP-glucose 4,6-dehydratase [Chthoniobacteraceae bacterium]|nr:CDP-glucose 4,6-dehydratase [Chthoniobacteraceae bacterium]